MPRRGTGDTTTIGQGARGRGNDGSGRTPGRGTEGTQGRGTGGGVLGRVTGTLSRAAIQRPKHLTWSG